MKTATEKATRQLAGTENSERAFTSFVLTAGEFGAGFGFPDASFIEASPGEGAIAVQTNLFAAKR
jgi:hypothetical protein